MGSFPLCVQMILSAIYVISPVDLIPEGTNRLCFGNLFSNQVFFIIYLLVSALPAGILGIVGLLDDLLIMLIFFFHIAAIYRAFLHRLHGGS